MKKITLLFCLFISTLVAISQDIISRPNPPTLLNDLAQVLSVEQQKTIEQNLDEFSNNTSNQIAVVILPSLHDYPIEDYATKLFRSWGIGQTKKNNGVLLLISMQEKKMKIETGYGLEGALPDIICSQIINNVIKPAFKQGDYYTGITQGIEQIKLAAKGEFNDKTIIKNKKDKKAPIKFFILLIIVIIVLKIMSKRGGGNGGGGFGDIATGFLIGSMLGGGRSNGNSDSGSFGGFGDFGGGSSGGGGASGDW